MVNSRQKGATGELKLAEFLKANTGLTFQRTPGSGSGKLKGDLSFPGCLYCIEVKNYAEDPLGSSILSNKTSLLPIWWKKLVKESAGKKPALFYKWNRSKWFVVISEKPTKVKNFIDIPSLSCYILLAQDWLDNEEIIWQRLKS